MDFLKIALIIVFALMLFMGFKLWQDDATFTEQEQICFSYDNGTTESRIMMHRCLSEVWQAEREYWKDK